MKKVIQKCLKMSDIKGDYRIQENYNLALIGALVVSGAWGVNQENWVN